MEYYRRYKKYARSIVEIYDWGLNHDYLLKKSLKNYKFSTWWQKFTSLYLQEESKLTYFSSDLVKII